MATSGRRAQEAIRAHGSKKCSKHYGKEVISVCETCDVLVCVDCATQQHNGHELKGISNVVPEAKQKLQDFINRAEGTEIPRIKEKFQKLNSDLSKNKTLFQQQVSQIKKQNEILKKELDKIADRMVESYHDMEQQNSDKLLSHQKTLQSQLDKLSSKIQKVKATLQSGNDVLVYDTSNEILPEFQDLPTPSYSTAEFIPGKLPLQQLEHLLGEINITDHYGPCLPLSQSANWRIMSEFTPYKGRNVESIHAADDEVWLSDCSKTMLSVNQKGQVQQTLHLGVCVGDFCISPQTGHIWFCSIEDNSVREVKDRRDQVKFITDTCPCSICVTKDDHILVGTKGQMVQYTKTGQKICTTSGGSPPVVMSECPQTRHIAVADEDWRRNGGNGVVSQPKAPIEPLKYPDTQPPLVPRDPTPPLQPLPPPLEPEGLSTAKEAAVRSTFSEFMRTGPSVASAPSAALIDSNEERFEDAIGEGMKICPVCSDSFSADIDVQHFENHVLSHIGHICPICLQLIEDTSDDGFMNHVNQHLDM